MLLNIEKLEARNENGWFDKSDIIFHASFQCLVDFVECEFNFESIDWDYDEQTTKLKNEIIYLYDWYMFDWSYDLHSLFNEHCQDHLERLIKIREDLWT